VITRIAGHRSAHRALRQSVDAKLTVPLHILLTPTPISWARLKEQFGQQYATAYQFRHKFKDTLALALAVYPDARIKETKAGITLYPSDPAVAKRHLKAAS
jgi:hypothetical protein